MPGCANYPAKGSGRLEGPYKTDVFKKICYESFTFLGSCSIDLNTATYSQLEEVFKESYQVDRDVARKCIKFFIEMAEAAGIPLSAFITKKSKRVHSVSPVEKIPKRNGIRTNQNSVIPNSTELIPKPVTWKELLLQKFPSFDPNWPNDVQLKWFEAFDELLKRDLFQAQKDRMKATGPIEAVPEETVVASVKLQDVNQAPAGCANTKHKFQNKLRIVKEVF